MEDALFHKLDDVSTFYIFCRGGNSEFTEVGTSCTILLIFMKKIGDSLHNSKYFQQN